MQKPPASAPLVGLIDQDVWLVRQLSEELQKLGFRVLGWTNSNSAAELLVREHCDVVVMDDVMTQLRGGRNLHTMALEKYGEERPRFILHSPTPSAISRHDRAFFDAVIAKPCSAETLRTAILDVIRSRYHSSTDSNAIPIECEASDNNASPRDHDPSRGDLSAR
jgi:DNA-binding response OmpR family regulator